MIHRLYWYAGMLSLRLPFEVLSGTCGATCDRALHEFVSFDEVFSMYLLPCSQCFGPFFCECVNPWSLLFLSFAPDTVSFFGTPLYFVRSKGFVQLRYIPQRNGIFLLC